jgi:hypothetical protein
MRPASLVLAAFLLASCGSVGLGDLGDILGSPSAEQASDVRGTVDNVDTRAMRIDLDTSYVNNLRDERQNQSVYYDNNTRVVFQNNTYRVEDLERGDEISIRGSNRDGRYVAETIEVLRDVSR